MVHLFTNRRNIKWNSVALVLELHAKYASYVEDYHEKGRSAQNYRSLLMKAVGTTVTKEMIHGFYIKIIYMNNVKSIIY